MIFPSGAETREKPAISSLTGLLDIPSSPEPARKQSTNGAVGAVLASRAGIFAPALPATNSPLDDSVAT